MSNDWIHTIRGVRLVEGTLPRLARALEGLSEQMAQARDSEEQDQAERDDAVPSEKDGYCCCWSCRFREGIEAIADEPEGEFDRSPRQEMERDVQDLTVALHEAEDKLEPYREQIVGAVRRLAPVIGIRLPDDHEVAFPTVIATAAHMLEERQREERKDKKREADQVRDMESAILSRETVEQIAADPWTAPSLIDQAVLAMAKAGGIDIRRFTRSLQGGEEAAPPRAVLGAVVASTLDELAKLRKAKDAYVYYLRREVSARQHRLTVLARDGRMGDPGIGAAFLELDALCSLDGLYPASEWLETRSDEVKKVIASGLKAHINATPKGEGEDKELLEGARELVKMLHRAVTEGEE